MLSDSELSAMVTNKIMPERKPYAPFATDKGLALEAALKVGFSVQVTQWEPGTVVARVNEGSYENRTEFATGTTVARALCLAALRASGVEVEDDGKEES